MPPRVFRAAATLRAFRVGGVISAVLLVYAGLHFYVAQRLIVAPSWPGAVSGPALLVLGLLGLSVPLRLAARRVSRAAWLRWFATPAYVWMGAGFLLVVAVAASDLLWVLASGLVYAGVASTALLGESAGPLGTARLQALLAGGVGIGASLLALWRGHQRPRLQRVALRIRDWPRELDGFRIVQISDLHIGARLRRSFAAAVVARVNALEPDLIAITGDLVDGRPEELRDEVEPFGKLCARHGCFFVTGNHDHYSGEELWVAQLQTLGIQALRNERVTIESRGASFVLAGVDDHRGGFGASTEDLPRALAGRDPGLPVVLLAHDPNSFAEASAMGVDLQLSGHTHGGQLWPFRYAVRLVTPWVAGLYQVAGAQLYVSCGTGYWGPPMRLGAPAEITELTLRRC
jgi:hypothetical protein